MRVLVTRPEPEASRTAARLVEAGHQPVISSLFQIVATGAPVDVTDVRGLIVTSRNALRVFDDADLVPLHHLPVFAVGEATALAAKECGFGNVTHADGDSRTLAETILENDADHASVYLHLCGVHVESSIEAVFAGAGPQLRRVVTYESRAVGEFSDEARSALEAGEIDAVLHYSARAAEEFLRLFDALSDGRVKPRACAISQRATAPFSDRPHWTVQIANKPDEDALLATL